MSLLLARHKSLYGVLRVVPLFRHIGWLSQLSKLVPVSLLKVLDPGGCWIQNIYNGQSNQLCAIGKDSLR